MLSSPPFLPVFERDIDFPEKIYLRNPRFNPYLGNSLDEMGRPGEDIHIRSIGEKDG